MSYFDDASLVMIPSGYKDQKVYSVKPLDGSGDLTFSRASSATRVASNGLIEKVRTNLVLQSEDFTTSWFPNIAPTITANTTVAPNGTTTADTIASSGTGSGVFQVPTVVNGVEYSFSIYVKNISSATNIRIGCDLAPANGLLNFNAVTGAIISTGAGITGSSVTNVGNGWYRVSGTYITTGTTNTFVVFGESAMSFAVWGAQLETGVTTDYIATTSAAVSVGPVSGLPRLDYLNSTCPRLLLEPQRTNSQTYSEQINNAAWGLSGVSVSANNATSPDGYTNADKIVESAANARHEFYGVTASFSGNNAVSFFAKAAGRRYICALEPTGAGGATFDLQTGTVATVTAVSASIENYGNGWYRCSVIINKTASTQIYYALRTTGSVGIETYTGDGTSGVLFYGAQTELSASYATSYIPTLGTSVTRVADAASKTGISSLIGQTEGTLFGEFTFTGIAPTMHLFASVAGSFGNAVYIQTFSATGISMQVWSGVANQVSINSSGLTAGQNVKFAAAYKNNDFVLYVNGVQVGTDTSGSVPSGLSQLEVGGYAEAGSPFNFNSSIKQAIVFPTRLSNSDLAALTA